MGEDEPRYATVAEIADPLEPHADATMLLTAVSETVILLETDSGFQILILSPERWEWSARSNSGRQPRLGRELDRRHARV